MVLRRLRRGRVAMWVNVVWLRRLGQTTSPYQELT